MNNFNIGIAGPPSGLSEFQINEIKTCVREALQIAKIVQLWVWRDTGSGHPVGSDHEDAMTSCAMSIIDSTAHVTIRWLEYSDKASVSAEQLRCVDVRLICPASKSSRQKSRTQTLRQHAEEYLLATRTILAWVTET